MWGVVDVPIERYFGPAEKVNITVPARVLPLGSNPLGHLLEAPGVGQAQAPKAWADALILGRTRPERDRR